MRTEYEEVNFDKRTIIYNQYFMGLFPHTQPVRTQTFLPSDSTDNRLLNRFIEERQERHDAPIEWRLCYTIVYCHLLATL